MKQTAQGLAALGRGPDTELVHMAPSEVKSLQQLALAHGGSLTINPQTGLPEAGFLSSMLPMIIGAGLSVASGGTLTPLMAAMMTGAGYGAATGSLKKGLMAGMGAYGGAGIGAGLAGAGAGTLEATTGAMGVPGAATGAGSQAAMLAAQNQGFGQAGLEALGQSAAVAPGAAPIAQSGADSMLAGFKGLGSEAGRSAFMQNVGGGSGLMKAGLAAAAPMLDVNATAAPVAPPGDSNMGQRYRYSSGVPNPQPTPDVPGYGNQNRDFGKEQQYYNPKYTPIDSDAAKALYGYAGGGPVEAMSNANAIGANTGYPQADIHTGAYASPTQTPISQNMVTGSQDAAVNPYTGEPQFADGGDVDAGGYTYDPATFTYKQNSRMATPTPAPIAAGMNREAIAETLPTYAYDSKTQKYVQTSAGTPAQAAVANVEPDSSSGGGGEKNGGLMAALAAGGGVSTLGGYSDGGRLLRGPGDGVSDSIPAVIGKKQPARLADGEFVIPARIVSELGNGSTEAGARQLYSMMQRIQSGRQKSIGKNKVATNTRASKHLPA